jgi:hypothetical protein
METAACPPAPATDAAPTPRLICSAEVEQPDDRWDNVGYLGCSIDVISSLDKPLLATTSGVGTDQCTLGPGTISPVTRGDRISV